MSDVAVMSDREIKSRIINAASAGSWGDLVDLANEAAARKLGPPAADGDIESPPPSEIGIGDVFEAVVVHPNKSDSRDPVCKVNGRTTYLRFPNKGDSPVSFGDVVKARMADKRQGTNLATALEADDGE